MDENASNVKNPATPHASSPPFSLIGDEEEYVLTEEHALLSFVKKSSIKGALSATGDDHENPEIL